MLNIYFLMYVNFAQSRWQVFKVENEEMELDCFHVEVTDKKQVTSLGSYL